MSTRDLPDTYVHMTPKGMGNCILIALVITGMYFVMLQYNKICTAFTESSLIKIPVAVFQLDIKSDCCIRLYYMVFN